MTLTSLTGSSGDHLESHRHGVPRSRSPPLMYVRLAVALKTPLICNLGTVSTDHTCLLLIISDIPDWPIFKLLPRSLSDTAWRQKVNHYIKVNGSLCLLLNFLVDLLASGSGSTLFCWDDVIGKESK